MPILNVSEILHCCLIPPWLLGIKEDIPDAAALILVLLGIVLAVVPLKKTWEIWIKARPWMTSVVVAICVLIGGSGFYVNRKERQQATQRMEHLSQNSDAQSQKSDQLSRKSDQLVTSMQQVIVATALLVHTETDSRASLNRLEADAKSRSQVNAAYKQFLVSMAKNLSQQITDLGQRWYDEDDRVLALSHPSERDAKRAQVARRYLAEARAPVETADMLRQQLLQQLPPDAHRDQDETEAAVIRRILTSQPYPLESLDVRRVGGLLLDLAWRVQGYRD